MSDNRLEVSSPALVDVDNATQLAALEASLQRAVQRLAQSRPFAKHSTIPPVLEASRRLLQQPGGAERLYEMAPLLDDAGVFTGTDWDAPHTLIASLVSKTLELGERHTVTIECISLLRILSIANGRYTRAGFSSEQAKHFLTQVLAHNLNRVFMFGQTEAERINASPIQEAINTLFRFLAEQVGYDNIIGSLSEEIWRILGQRPIQVNHVKAMITQIAITLSQAESPLGESRLGVDRLISALFGPTQQCLDDPGIDCYRQRLAIMDFKALQQEAMGFARAMHDVGLVSDYHAVFLRWLLEENREELITETLGLSSTGIDCLRCYHDLVRHLINEAIFPETAQAIYGLTMLLERGLLYNPPIAPSLWRQIGLSLSPSSSLVLTNLFGTSCQPRVHLLAGVISVLGQPLGIGQGNNPTCQSARAISMWSLNDPDYLLHLIAQVASLDNILMHFEGAPLSSATLPAGMVQSTLLDNDPVSTLLVPHLDRIYHQMGSLCANRDEDPHNWINPEFHGWWVGREFAIAVDVKSGLLKNYEGFVRHFFASYHPFYNGNRMVIHPQPAGLAVTDSSGRFIGWHAITLLRVALDQAGEMRVYFYNPNNDSGQNWGGDVIVSTQGNSERYGESSLPFSQLASRLYIFHDDPLADPAVWSIPQTEIQQVKAMASESWAAQRLPA